MPAARSVSMSRRLLTTRIAVIRHPIGIDAATASGVTLLRHDVGRADDRHRAEKEKDEDLTQTQVAKRLRARGVGHGRQHGQESRPRRRQAHPARRDTGPGSRQNQRRPGRHRDLSLRRISPLCVTRGGPSARRCPRRGGNRRRRWQSWPRSGAGAPPRRPRAPAMRWKRALDQATAQPTITGETAAGSVLGRAASSQAGQADVMRVGEARDVAMEAMVPRPLDAPRWSRANRPCICRRSRDLVTCGYVSTMLPVSHAKQLSRRSRAASSTALPVIVSLDWRLRRVMV